MRLTAIVLLLSVVPALAQEGAPQARAPARPTPTEEVLAVALDRAVDGLQQQAVGMRRQIEMLQAENERLRRANGSAKVPEKVPAVQPPPIGGG